MEVSVEKTSELGRKMMISIPEAIVQDKVNERLKSLAGEVKIDGFRSGKIPQKVVQQRYGARIKKEITGSLIEENYFQALRDNNLHPAGMPHIEPVKCSEGITFIAVFEVYAKFTLDAVATIHINRPVASVEASDIDAMIDTLKEQHKNWQASEQDSQIGDRVTITFSASCEGENFTGGEVDNFQVELGSKRMVAGFEEQLSGLSVGAKKTFTATFPQDYGNKKIAGKAVEFKIDVLKIATPVLPLPEIDADFIKAYGIESGTLTEFRADVKNNMQHKLTQALKVMLKNSVMDALYATISVSLPNVLVDQEIKSLMKSHDESAKKRNVDINYIKPTAADFASQAKRHVALSLILAEIIRQNAIKVEADKTRLAINNMAQSYADPEQVINWYYSDKQRIAEVEQMLLEDAVVDWVLKKIQVTDAVVSFNDVLQSTTQQGFLNA